VTYLLLALAALAVLVVARATRLELLRELSGALAIVSVASLGQWAATFFGAPRPWSGWVSVVLLLALGYLAARTALLIVFEWLLVRRIGLKVPRLAREVVALIIYLVMAAVILRAALGIEVGALLATSAVLTVVIGLALQETLGTLLAGLALAWEARLSAGMWIEIDGVVGRVQELGWRSLVIRTRLGDRLVVPNSTVARSNLRLLGSGVSPVGVPIRLGVAYGHPPDRVKEVLYRVCVNLPGVLPHPAPQVLVVEYADSAIVYECRLWTRTPWRNIDLTDSLLTRGYAALARADMQIPFPQRTVHMAPRPLESDAPQRCLDALGACSLFEGLPAEALSALAEESSWLRFAPDELVVRQDDASRALFVIARGAAVVEADGETISRLEPGEVFGEVSFLTGEPRSASVRTLEATHVVEVDSGALGALLEQHPHLAEELAARMARRQQGLLEAQMRSPVLREPRTMADQLRSALLRLVGGSSDT